MFTTNTHLKPGIFVLSSSLLLFLPSCASEPPKEALFKAEAAIQDADRAGASEYEPQLLSSARTKLNRAKKDADEDESDKARRLAEEARAEAVLAGAKTEAAKQARQTDEMMKTIEALRQESSRTSEGQ